MATRLQAISDFITPCHAVLDMGSDHALLGVLLLRSRKANHVFNVEKAPGPLAAGKRTAAKEGLADGFTHVLSDGFKNVPTGIAVDAVVVAGMGAATFARIMDGCGLAWEELVVQPASNAEAVRRFASLHGWWLVGERVVFERKFYEVLKFVRQTGRQQVLTPAELMFGPFNLKYRTAAFIEQWRAALAHYESVYKKHPTALVGRRIAMIREMMGSDDQRGL